MELRRKLLEVFDVEYREHLEAIRRLLGDAGPAGTDGGGFDLSEAVRRAHSLKGAARAVGLEEVEAIAHRLESRFIDAGDGNASLNQQARRLIADSLDEIEDKVVGLLNEDAGEDSGRGDGAEVAPPSEALPTPAEAWPKPAAPAEAWPKPAAPAEAWPKLAAPAAGGGAKARAPAAQAASVRVDAEKLDRLLKSAGELRADMLFQSLSTMELGRLGKDIALLEGRWSRTWRQVEGMLRESGGPGLSGLLGQGDELSSEIRGLSKRWRAASQGQETATRSLRHHLDDLERRVKSARMMPIESSFGSFRKMVRDLAASEGKQVEVVIEGLDCEADRLVVQRIKDPVMHMLRNAVSHGIEPPEVRASRGKEPKGQIRLRVSNQHDRLIIVIEDDGGGIDFPRIAAKAVEQGLLDAQDAEDAGRETLLELLFEPGFSTVDSVTRISGRGVGLSVVRDTISGLQGSFEIASDPGAGTRLEISLPVSVLSRRLLLLSFKQQTYALPAEAVTKVMRVAAEDVVTVEGQAAIRLSDSTLPLVSLGELLGLGDPVVSTETSSICAVIVRANGARSGAAADFALAVESFVGVNDFLVRSLEVGRSAERLWSGVINAEDGTPCLVLNTSALLKREPGRTDVVFRIGQRDEGEAKVVLVVDDSITTRTLEKSILEAHGYEVRLSVDGRDALGILRRDPPSIVVSDIEMPHVNGFELVEEMKSDRALSKIPVVLVTSRADEKDRERGLRLGADAYIVKQRFDQNELLRTIRQII